MSAKSDNVRVELIVHGWVHVVSYQYRVLAIAEELGIVGRIWTKTERSVAINAEGDKAKILEFINRIRILPLSRDQILGLQAKGEIIPPQPLARVESIEGESTFLAYTGKYKKFDIIAEAHDDELRNSVRTIAQLVERLRMELYYNIQTLNEHILRLSSSHHHGVATQALTLENGAALGLRMDLGHAPLLIAKAPKGFVMCGYLNLEAAAKHNDLAGKVTGVSSFEALLDAPIVAVTEAAKKAGLHEGMTARSFLNALM